MVLVSIEVHWAGGKKKYQLQVAAINSSCGSVQYNEQSVTMDNAFHQAHREEDNMSAGQLVDWIVRCLKEGAAPWTMEGRTLSDNI